MFFCQTAKFLCGFLSMAYIVSTKGHEEYRKFMSQGRLRKGDELRVESLDGIVIYTAFSKNLVKGPGKEKYDAKAMIGEASWVCEI